MKKPLISFIATLFFIAVFFYASSTLSPIDKDKFTQFLSQYQIKNQEELLSNFNHIVQSGMIWQLLNLRNLTIWLVLLGFAITLSFTTIHLFIDKLFFKKFFEQPSVLTAVRRGVFLYLTMLGIILLRLIGGLYWYNALALILLFLAFELAALNIWSGKTKHEQKLRDKDKQTP